MARVTNHAPPLNLALDTDSYKLSHPPLYPPDQTAMSCYWEARAGGQYALTEMAGLQWLIKAYLSQPVTKEMIDEGVAFGEPHGIPFPEEGWRHIVNKHGGYLPLRIRSVPEGTLVPIQNLLMDVEATDEKVFWLPTWMETQLSRLWYATTVATRGWYGKKIIYEFLVKTADAPDEEINWKLHDFGSRGVGTPETAAVGGMAHLFNFMGSDTIIGVRHANFYYNHKMAAFSIPALEHSVMMSWGKDHELEGYEHMLKTFAKPGKIVACVSDTFNFWNAIEVIWGTKLHERVEKTGATIGIRPDSGDPVVVVRKALEVLDSKFGSTLNTKGYKVLKNIRVVQGDGMTENSIRAVLSAATEAGYSTTNITFGMGGYLLQKLDRDTQKFGYKPSIITRGGQQIPVKKEPVDDPVKHSKPGRLDLQKRNNKLETVTIGGGRRNEESEMMKVVFENGELVKEYSLDEIRRRAWPGV
jgi:nicotinamide phosphoribosyltransferase